MVFSNLYSESKVFYICYGPRELFIHEKINSELVLKIQDWPLYDLPFYSWSS